MRYGTGVCLVSLGGHAGQCLEPWNVFSTYQASRTTLNASHDLMTEHRLR
jgi:hypothetical protein